MTQYTLCLAIFSTDGRSVPNLVT